MGPGHRSPTQNVKPPVSHPAVRASFVDSELGTATTVLDALVDEPREEVGPDYELAPFGIKSRRRLCGNCFLDRPTLFLEIGDIPADGRQHIVKVCQLGPVADGLAMARNDDCGVGS